MPRALRVALVAALLLPLSACDSDAESAVAENTFTLRVADGETRTWTGAAFGHYDDPDAGDTFALVLGGEPGGDASAAPGPVVGFVRLGGIPGEGRYPLMNLFDGDGSMSTPQTLGVYLDPSELAQDDDDPFSFGGFYVATSGALTLDVIDDEHAVGSFTMTVAPLTFDPEVGEPEGFDVEGEFHATFSDAIEGGGMFRRALPVRLPF